MDQPTRIHVAVRLRPRLPSEAQDSLAVIASHDQIQLVSTPKARRLTSYKFDRVFTPEDTNSTVYETFLRPLVAHALRGTHATVLAYGQTGTGKTFTMLGRDLWGLCAHGEDDQDDITLRETTEDPMQRGLMYFVAQELLQAKQGPVRCSYLELYNEKVFDLTRDDKSPLDLREDAIHGVFLPALQVRPLHSVDTLTDILWRGAKARACRATNMNERSSRSHTILQLHVDSTDGATTTINLVDLAGSEKCKKLSSRDQDIKELKFINQSLSTLGQCISALMKRDKLHGGPLGIAVGSVHVPYRNSKLTRLLQPSLGGGGLCSFIVTLNPCKSSAQETLSTLQFATRAMKVSVSCEPCLDSRRETQRQVSKSTFNNNSSSSSASSNDIVAQLRAENKKLAQALEMERQQKRKLLLGFTSLLSGEYAKGGSKEAAQEGDDGDNGRLSEDVLAKLSTLEVSMQSQLQGIQATKDALTSQATTALQSNWDEYIDDTTGFKYFHNSQTGETRWTKPST
ncbi:hypothetical protein Ae201684_008574 [Aphanomyces euteiches]|uniref:Kinesin-like protein n=1 Tax=Aphanomyces euteiches TaxID=100861 RepID=A0A6G0X4M3_9STRA|nr:hypothetical protein Ae201684_008574 [Aphanomyces euteiches]KAH9138896.1 hypothetical protein AeRB84_016811 [Aphanomyces euteiches]